MAEQKKKNPAPPSAGRRKGTFEVRFARLPERKLRRVLRVNGIDAARQYAKEGGIEPLFRRLEASGLVAQREQARKRREINRKARRIERRAAKQAARERAEKKAKLSARAKKAAVTRKAKKAATANETEAAIGIDIDS